MDCTFPFRSARQRLLQLDEEQSDQWKYSLHIRPRYHHSERSLSPVGQGCQNSRLEPLECRDLVVQNALFTGDLEMVRKHFTKSAAINLIIETKGDELRWTSRKFGGCAGLGRGGDGKCPGWEPEKEHRHLRKVLRGIPSGGDRVVEEGLGKKGFWMRKEDSRAVEQMVAGLLKVARGRSTGKW